ncbi:MAG: 50S ribosomal protein L11 methyltransferase [Candidatus Marsarchaeota archaeon]|nr:50S ribosomal protein L11 methyltransferase [Candidatus Marsarchaeota archaeon]MCL5413151.1 50S ribosomal protein L11 methyltransferase [Candidatus Marsarchaeota archaeon]
MVRITEGKAKVYVNNAVFYNPRMKGLRDLSVSFLKAIGCEDKRVLDATAATGIRAIRYAKECKAKKVVALDINRDAYNICRKNIRLNRLKIDAKNMSIREYASNCRDKFEIVDFDPFGSPAPVLHDLLTLCGDGSIIMVTATDTAVLCGAHAAACIKVYGSKPLHNELCKEVGIRILLNYISRTASQFNFGILPLLSVSDMHYMRVFARLEFGASNAVGSVNSNGLGSFCRKCYKFAFARGIAPSIEGVCPTCKSKVELFGPLWLGQLYDKGILSKMRKNSDLKIIRTISDEYDTLLFYSVPKITKLLCRSSVSQRRVIESLLRSGKEATRTQFDIDGVKTDAEPQRILSLIKKL